MTIALVTKPDKRMTGLLRYALSLYDPLRARGVDIAMVYPRSPVPVWLARTGRAVGLDAVSFFDAYPFSVPIARGQVCHLTSQSLATVLLFQRLHPTLVTVHDIIPYLVRNDAALSTYRHSFARLFDRLSLVGLRRATGLIAISEYTRQTLVSALGFRTERIRVVYRAVDTEVFRPLPVPLAFKQKYGLDGEHPYVLYVGSEDPRKNLEGLIRAFAIVREHVPAARLLKAGAAHFESERERLLCLVDELNLRDSVCFLDQVPDADLPLLYNAVSVFVLPSFYEGFGLPALEAMSCGTPVIASNRASLPEVVGPEGLLFDPEDHRALADQLVALLTDADRRSVAAEAALRRSQCFSLERQASETLAAYGELT